MCKLMTRLLKAYLSDVICPFLRDTRGRTKRGNVPGCCFLLSLGIREEWELVYKVVAFLGSVAL